MWGVLLSGSVLAALAAMPAAAVADTTAEDPPTRVPITGTVRDFRGYDLPAVPAAGLAPGHVDFEGPGGGSEKGIVTPELGADGRPVYAKGESGSRSASTHGQAAFDQWYRDTPGVNLTFPLNLGLGLRGDGRFAFTIPSFFPLDAAGFVTLGQEPMRNDGDGVPRNFSFTTELHSDITYRAGGRIDLLGDDDIWVFVDGRLALDLGGTHGAEAGTVRLDDLGLTEGQTYALDIFQAERHTNGSSYQLTVPRLGIIPGQPSIPDAAKTGDTLTCATGAWPAGVKLGFTWFRGDTPIPGATKADYPVATLDAGRRLTCRVTGTGPRTATAADSAGVVVALPPLTPEPPVERSPLEAYRCLRRERFSLDLRDGRRRVLRSASVLVGGSRVSVRRNGRRAFKATVDLRRRPAGLYTVKTRVVSRGGAVTRKTFRYRVCD